MLIRSEEGECFITLRCLIMKRIILCLAAMPFVFAACSSGPLGEYQDICDDCEKQIKKAETKEEAGALMLQCIGKLTQWQAENKEWANEHKEDLEKAEEGVKAAIEAKDEELNGKE